MTRTTSPTIIEIHVRENRRCNQ